jgi:hypothetical protein
MSSPFFLRGTSIRAAAWPPTSSSSSYSRSAKLPCAGCDFQALEIDVPPLEPTIPLTLRPRQPATWAIVRYGSGSSCAIAINSSGGEDPLLLRSRICRPRLHGNEFNGVLLVRDDLHEHRHFEHLLHLVHVRAAFPAQRQRVQPLPNREWLDVLYRHLALFRDDVVLEPRAGTRCAWFFQAHSSPHQGSARTKPRM